MGEGVTHLFAPFLFLKRVNKGPPGAKPRQPGLTSHLAPPHSPRDNGLPPPVKTSSKSKQKVQNWFQVATAEPWWPTFGDQGDRGLPGPQTSPRPHRSRLPTGRSSGLGPTRHTPLPLLSPGARLLRKRVRGGEGSPRVEMTGGRAGERKEARQAAGGRALGPGLRLQPGRPRV